MVGKISDSPCKEESSERDPQELHEILPVIDGIVSLSRTESQQESPKNSEFDEKDLNDDVCENDGLKIVGKVVEEKPSYFDIFLFIWKHPWVRLFIATFVVFCNFLIYAEDPIAHSRVNARLPVIGNAISFLARQYPNPFEETAYFSLKLSLVILSLFAGWLFGRYIVHHMLLRDFLKLKMFAKDKGSWFIMSISIILNVFIFSLFYNSIISLSNPKSNLLISDYLGLTNENFMKIASLCTWMGDSITLFMVLDMMLQDRSLYSNWMPWLRNKWQGRTRIIIFWVIMAVLTSVVAFVIISPDIHWDQNGGQYIHTDEWRRALLAAFITLFDIFIVMQDWDFPHFRMSQDINVVGLNVSGFQFDFLQRLFSSVSWRIHITGKWFNYGIIFVVMCLDMNMLKNQIIYFPRDFGQYVEPETLRIWNVKSEIEANDPNVLANLSFETRGGHLSDDELLFATYHFHSFPQMIIASIPVIFGFIFFFLLYSKLNGYFPRKSQQMKEILEVQDLPIEEEH